MRVKTLVLLIILAALTALLASTASAAQISVDEALISPSFSKMFQLNLDNSGNLIVSDEAGLIWQLNPLTGNYTYYDLVVTSVTDAHLAADGKYWFTNNENGIGYADPNWGSGTGRSVRWDYTLGGDPSIYNFGALALDGLGGVWIADSFGSESSYIYQLLFAYPTSAQLCALLPSLGDAYTTYAYDLILNDGYLWYYNWFEEKIYRFNPVPIEGQYELTAWTVANTSNTFIEGRVLAVDGSGRLWIPGGAAGTVMSFDINSNVLTTYTIPAGSHSVEGVTVNSGVIWFIDEIGGAGTLDPLVASGVARDISDKETTIHLSPSCSSLGTALPSSPLAKSSGTLSFTPKSFSGESYPGWQLFTLSDNDVLNGVNASAGAVFASDALKIGSPPNRLLRFSSQTRLIVTKSVINDNGGTAVASDFTFRVNGGSPIRFETNGQVILPVDPGTYNVVENPTPGYTPSYLKCSNIEITEGQTVTCSITNDDILPSNSSIYLPMIQK